MVVSLTRPSFQLLLSPLLLPFSLHLLMPHIDRPFAAARVGNAPPPPATVNRRKRRLGYIRRTTIQNLRVPSPNHSLSATASPKRTCTPPKFICPSGWNPFTRSRRRCHGAVGLVGRRHRAVAGSGFGTAWWCDLARLAVVGIGRLFTLSIDEIGVYAAASGSLQRTSCLPILTLLSVATSVVVADLAVPDETLRCPWLEWEANASRS